MMPKCNCQIIFTTAVVVIFICGMSLTCGITYGSEQGAHIETPVDELVKNLMVSFEEDAVLLSYKYDVELEAIKSIIGEFDAIQSVLMNLESVTSSSAQEEEYLISNKNTAQKLDDLALPPENQSVDK